MRWGSKNRLSKIEPLNKYAIVKKINNALRIANISQKPGTKGNCSIFIILTIARKPIRLLVALNTLKELNLNVQVIGFPKIDKSQRIEPIDDSTVNGRLRKYEKYPIRAPLKFNKAKKPVTPIIVAYSGEFVQGFRSMSSSTERSDAG